VIALVALAALSNFRLPIRGLTEAANGASSDGIPEYLNRCRRLEAHLPARGQIGYRAPSDHARTHSHVKGDRLQLMRYALAPRIIEQFWDHELVIFDADDPASNPSPMESRGWQVVTDLNDGMKIFRTKGEE
jgi:hypothetical protein